MPTVPSHPDKRRCSQATQALPSLHAVPVPIDCSRAHIIAIHFRRRRPKSFVVHPAANRRLQLLFSPAVSFRSSGSLTSTSIICLHLLKRRPSETSPLRRQHRSTRCCTSCSYSSASSSISPPSLSLTWCKKMSCRAPARYAHRLHRHRPTPLRGLLTHCRLSTHVKSS